LFFCLHIHLLLITLKILLICCYNYINFIIFLAFDDDAKKCQCSFQGQGKANQYDRQAPKQTARFRRCTIRQQVFKYWSCKICFNVLNYVPVFILFTFNLYRLVSFNSLATILAVVTDNAIYS